MDITLTHKEIRMYKEIRNDFNQRSLYLDKFALFFEVMDSKLEPESPPIKKRTQHTKSRDERLMRQITSKSH
jgi:hypothetical protein